MSLLSAAALLVALIPAADGPASMSGADTAVEPFLVVNDIRGVPRNGRHDRGPWFLGPVPVTADAGVTPPDADAQGLHELSGGMTCTARPGTTVRPGFLTVGFFLAGMFRRRRRG